MKNRDIWWITLWNQLCFDARERLGVDFGKLPIRTALTWGQSVINIEGSHCYGYLLERKLRQDKKTDESLEDSNSRLTLVQMGGRFHDVEEMPEDEYWSELERR